MNGDILRRLERLELVVGGDCRLCHGAPGVRIVCLDEDLTVNGETFPEHCPECGAPASQTLELVGLTVDELP